MTTKVRFQLPAEYAANASEGVLLGEFNNWNPQKATSLELKEDGSLEAELSLTAGKTYQYRYFLSDGRWVNDNSNTTWAELYGGFVENCVVEVPAAVGTMAEQSPAMAANKAVPGKKAVTKKIVSAKTKAVADDLSKIPGINKKVISLLKKHGFISYKDLSATTIKNLKTILQTSGEAYSSINPASWPKSAKLAAAGKWEELNSLTTESKSSK
ncbi:MAG: isoamylase early set domain-containing protein [Ferruginibacter sp.]